MLIGRQQEFLVDTGATVTLVSESLSKKLQISVRPTLYELAQTIVTANNTELAVFGMFALIRSHTAARQMLQNLR